MKVVVVVVSLESGASYRSCAWFDVLSIQIFQINSNWRQNGKFTHISQSF